MFSHFFDEIPNLFWPPATLAASPTLPAPFATQHLWRSCSTRLQRWGGRCRACACRGYPIRHSWLMDVYSPKYGNIGLNRFDLLLQIHILLIAMIINDLCESVGKKRNMSCLEAFSWLTGVFDLLPTEISPHSGTVDLSHLNSTHGIQRNLASYIAKWHMHQLYQPLKHLVISGNIW